MLNEKLKHKFKVFCLWPFVVAPSQARDAGPSQCCASKHGSGRRAGIGFLKEVHRLLSIVSCAVSSIL